MQQRSPLERDATGPSTVNLSVKISAGVGHHDTFTGISDPAWYLPEAETIDHYGLEGDHIKFYANFAPGFDARKLDYITGFSSANPEGLEEMSEIELRGNGFKARLSCTSQMLCPPL